MSTLITLVLPLLATLLGAASVVTSSVFVFRGVLATRTAIRSSADARADFIGGVVIGAMGLVVGAVVVAFGSALTDWSLLIRYCKTC